MLNWIIRSSLNNRVLVVIAALLVSVYGLWVTLKTPTDVLPDLNRPVVTIMTEAAGLAPEDRERGLRHVLGPVGVVEDAEGDRIDQARVAPDDLGERLRGGLGLICGQQFAIGHGRTCMDGHM